ncbi:hypothetical protein ACE6H2_012822 [Prunus campanulata]
MDRSNDEDQKLVAVPKKYSNNYLFYLGQLLMKRTLKLLLSVSLFLLFSCSHTSINNHESHDESLDQDAIAYAAGEDEGESPTIQEEEDDDDGDGQQEELKNGTLLQVEEIPQAFSAEEKGGRESLIKQREEEMDTPELETNHVNDYLATTSTYELNKKFEEFIRKMKEEIRIEAQRQPIAV